jgi:HlyD family secretion protein
MTNANDVNNPPPADGAPARNGAATLRDRVRSLRLSERGAEGGRRSLPAVLLPWGLCVILLGVTVAFGYYAYAIAPTRTAADLKPAPEAGTDSPGKGLSSRGVTSDIASSGEVVLESKGYIIPVHQVQVSPKVAGMLVSISPKLLEGEQFSEGEELARIEDENYKDDCEHAQLAFAAADDRYKQRAAELSSARASLEFKQDTYTRDQQLAQTGGSISSNDLIRDKTDVNAQDYTVKALEFAVSAALRDKQAALADKKKAEWNLENCKIRAPVSGTILKKGAEMGNIVNPIAFNISSSLCDMADLSQLEVDLKIQERDIAKVEKDQPCVAMPEAWQNDPGFLKIHPKGYTGKVSRLMPSADRGQGAIPVRVKLDIPKEEEGRYLKPDMGVTVEFLKKG